MIHKALRMAREFHHMKQNDLAKQLRISTSYLSEIETGKKPPSIELLEAYGRVFNIYMKLVTAATPELSDEERFWRIHFMLGATVFTLSGADSLSAMAEYDLGKGSDIAQVVDKLVPFLAAGVNAPHR